MVVNLVVGGDYGFLNKPPLVGSFTAPNYLIVSTVIVIAIRLTGKLVENFTTKSEDLFKRRSKMIFFWFLRSRKEIVNVNFKNLLEGRIF